MIAPLEKSLEEFDAKLAEMTSADAFRELDAVRRELEERLEAVCGPVLITRQELDATRALLREAMDAIEKRIAVVRSRRADEFLAMLSEAIDKARRVQ